MKDRGMWEKGMGGRGSRASILVAPGPLWMKFDIDPRTSGLSLEPSTYQDLRSVLWTPLEECDRHGLPVSIPKVGGAGQLLVL